MLFRSVAQERHIGASRDALISADGEWALYDALAPEITRAHRGPLAQSAVAVAAPKRRGLPFLRLVK